MVALLRIRTTRSFWRPRRGCVSGRRLRKILVRGVGEVLECSRDFSIRCWEKYLVCELAGPGVREQSGSWLYRQGGHQAFTVRQSALRKPRRPRSINVERGYGPAGDFLSPHYMDQWEGMVRGYDVHPAIYAAAVEAGRDISVGGWNLRSRTLHHDRGSTQRFGKASLEKSIAFTSNDFPVMTLRFFAGHPWLCRKSQDATLHDVFD